MNDVDVPQRESALARFGGNVVVMLGATVLSLACFLVLPLLEAISQGPRPDLTLVPVDTAALPPPPPVEDEQPPEEKPEEKPPELAEDAPPLDLEQLEMALSAGGEGSGLGGDFAIKIQGLGGGGDDGDSVFSLKDLDQKPREVHRPAPVLSAALRKRRPASVTVLFIVDENGRVENPIVQSSSDPAFEAAVLTAIKQWKFEPGKRGGKAVRSPLRQLFKFEG